MLEKNRINRRNDLALGKTNAMRFTERRIHLQVGSMAIGYATFTLTVPHLLIHDPNPSWHPLQRLCQPIKRLKA